MQLARTVITSHKLFVFQHVILLLRELSLGNEPEESDKWCKNLKICLFQGCYLRLGLRRIVTKGNHLAFDVVKAFLTEAVLVRKQGRSRIPAKDTS